MSDTRTITLHMDAVTQSTMRQETNGKAWEAALGYLSQWNMSFPHVDIYPDGSTDMYAVYRRNPDPTTQPGYVIGAVWHDDHYGFHS